MIRSFRDKDTEGLFNLEPSGRLPPDIQNRAHRKLLRIDAAQMLSDLSVFPGDCLEKLKGSREGQHSIRINNQWRICFVWKDGDAYLVEICDYH